MSMDAFKITLLCCCTLFASSSLLISTALDTLTTNQTIRDDGNSSIVSAGEIFELGFFSPGSSKNRYVGIWYKKIAVKTVVWVANREAPLFDTKGILRLDVKGDLVLVNGSDSIVWSSSLSTISAISPVAKLLDTGNLVIVNDLVSETFVWQSFDHPGNTRLPGMKIGWDLVEGLETYLTSWKSEDDPSAGDYTYRMNVDGYPQLLIWKREDVHFRYGPWDGIEFSGVSISEPNPSFSPKFVFSQKELYYEYEISSSSIVMRTVLDVNGSIQLLTGTDRTQGWVSSLTTQGDDCDQYAYCGLNGKCNITHSRLGYDICECLRGFEPKIWERWRSGDRSSGCVRKVELDCGDGEGFLKFTGLKLPDTRYSWYNQSMSLEECGNVCLKNCSCTAYSNMDIREGGSGCLLWYGDLIDIRDYKEGALDLYVRMASSGLDEGIGSKSKGQKGVKVIAVSVTLTAVFLLLLVLLVLKKRKQKEVFRNIISTYTRKENEAGDLELPLFDFVKIANSTSNFSNNNKLGEGGFGPVYKGILEDGQEIAVKRLSETSQQGLAELKNEVSLISKLQHRNLVRLLGCCIEGGDMMLIYEYMPNKSLDSSLFDKELSRSLDWPTRYNIINGVARGLLYLHEDSRLRIIHRDLKASNILLDHAMNPRISDFGLARSFGGNETEKNTARVVGTYGYMAPEYALDGLFSVKSDVYSFGVLVLEIISGMKMKSFYSSDPGLNLLGHAWSLYQEGKLSELVDETIVKSCNQFQAFRAIQIGLLCVQSHPDDRPSMAFVVLMLSSDAKPPQPNQPGFYINRENLHQSSLSLNKPQLSSSNKSSITHLLPR